FFLILLPHTLQKFAFGSCFSQHVLLLFTILLTLGNDCTKIFSLLLFVLLFVFVLLLVLFSLIFLLNSLINSLATGIEFIDGGDDNEVFGEFELLITFAFVINGLLLLLLIDDDVVIVVV